MRLSWGKIAAAVLVLVVSFGGAVWTMGLFSGAGSGNLRAVWRSERGRRERSI